MEEEEPRGVEDVNRIVTYKPRESIPRCLEKEVCSICLDQLVREKDDVCRIKNCGHYFHSECINLWLKNHSICPNDRQSVL